MSSVSKRFAAVVVSLVLTSGSLYARPSQDPGSDRERSIGSRIVKLVKAIRNLVKVGQDDLSVPHP
jgi:hypothetical protein